MPDQEARDRRALKKARTRVEVRRAAQRLFAERSFDEVTVADIATTAEVAVQTVFNHFASKEELYFADRVPWVAGPAAAVSDRQPGTGAVATVHAWLVHHVCSVPVLLRRPSYRGYLEVVLASPSLRVHQRELHREAEERLAAALCSTWTAELGPLPGLRLTAALASGVFLAGARVVLEEQWRELSTVPLDAPDAAERTAEVRRTSRTVLDAIGAAFPQAATRPDVSAGLRAVWQLEADRPADLRAARSTRPRLARSRQESVAATTGSSTVSTSSATSSVLMGTANAV